jgi:hypothetical protein
MLLTKTENPNGSMEIVAKDVHICAWCQINKHTTFKTNGLLKSIQAPVMVSEFLWLDLCGQLSKKSCTTKYFILVIIDRLSQHL